MNNVADFLTGSVSPAHLLHTDHHFLLKSSKVFEHMRKKLSIKEQLLHQVGDTAIMFVKSFGCRLFVWVKTTMKVRTVETEEENIWKCSFSIIQR